MNHKGKNWNSSQETENNRYLLFLRLVRHESTQSEQNSWVANAIYAYLLLLGRANVGSLSHNEFINFEDF